MCHVIQIENVISNYFVRNNGKNRVSFATLSSFKKDIESSFRELERYVYINYNRASLINAAKNNPEYFTLGKSDILCDTSKYESLNEFNEIYFNAKIPLQIKEDYLRIFTKINNKYEQAS